MTQGNITDIRGLRDQIKGRMGKGQKSPAKVTASGEEGIARMLRDPQFIEDLGRCVPAGVNYDVDRLLGVVESQLRVDSKLKAAEPRSILGAVLECAGMGLMPGPLAHIHITTRMREHPEGGFEYEAQVIPGYRGLIALAMRSGNISSICARIVYEAEIEDESRFSLYYEGASDFLTHKPILFGERGEPAAVYCLIRFKDGSFKVEPIRADEMEQIKEGALRKTFGEDSPWYDYEMEMWKKTAIRRAMKYLDIQVEGMARALQLDNSGFLGESQALALRLGSDAAQAIEPARTEEAGTPATAAEARVGADPDRPDAGSQAG